MYIYYNTSACIIAHEFSVVPYIYTSNHEQRFIKIKFDFTVKCLIGKGICTQKDTGYSTYSRGNVTLI